MNNLTGKILIFVLLNFLSFVKGDKFIWTAGGYTLYQNLDTVRVNDVVTPNYIVKNAKSVPLTDDGFVTVWTSSTSGVIYSQIFDNKSEPVNGVAELSKTDTVDLQLDVATFPNNTYGVTLVGGGINGYLTYIAMYQYNVRGHAVYEDGFGSFVVNDTDPHSIFWNDLYITSYTAPDGVYIFETANGPFKITKVSNHVNGTDWSYTSQVVSRGDFYSVIWSRTSTSGAKNSVLYYRNYKADGLPTSDNIHVDSNIFGVRWYSAALSNNELVVAWLGSGGQPFVTIFNNQKSIAAFTDTVQTTEVSILPVLDGFFLSLVGNMNDKNQIFARYIQNEKAKPIGPYFIVGVSDDDRPTGAIFSNPQNGNFSISWTNFGQYNTNNIKNKNLFYSTYSLVKNDTNIPQIKF